MVSKKDHIFLNEMQSALDSELFFEDSEFRSELIW